MILVVGLGSMGKRRIRNLQALGYTNIAGYDLRADRKKEAAELYKIKILDSLSLDAIKALIISVPPDVHHIYMKLALEKNIPFFVEASVVDTDMAEIITLTKKQNLFAAPSSTLYFHPAIQLIFSLIKNGSLGEISNIMYHMGNYLPDWHTYEKVSDFYVSKKETGGAREIVPFELTWITKLLGFPKRVCGTHKKTIEIEGAPLIDDTYNALLDYDSFTLVLTVDVVTKSSTRRLLINGSKKQLIWDWEEHHIRIFNHPNQTWETIEYKTISAESGYNKNITEQMYIEEMKCFFDGIKTPENYVNTLAEDHKVLKLLYAMEESYQAKKFIELCL